MKANVDPRLDGLYELFWDPDHPSQNSTQGCRITGFVRNKLITIQWKGPVPYADLMNVEPLPTWVTISFETIDSHSTIIHFRHSGWGDSDKWKEAHTWQERAWQSAFDELQKTLN